MYCLAVLFLGLLSGVFMKPKNSSNQDLVNTSVDRILQHLFSSDKIDQIAATIAERAAQKFNDLQIAGHPNGPVLRSNINHPTKLVADRKSNTNNKTKVLTRLIHDFITPKASLPLKNLDLKYKMFSAMRTTAITTKVANGNPSISIGDILHFNTKTSHEIEKDLATKHEDIKDVLELYRNNHTSIDNKTGKDAVGVFNSEEAIASKRLRNTTLDFGIGDKKATRKENDKIYTFQSSEDYAEYHQQMTELRRSKNNK